VSTVWLVEVRRSKRGPWRTVVMFPSSKREAMRTAKVCRANAAQWGDREYRVAKYVREEPAK